MATRQKANKQASKKPLTKTQRTHAQLKEMDRKVVFNFFKMTVNLGDVFSEMNDALEYVRESNINLMVAQEECERAVQELELISDKMRRFKI